MIPATLDNEVRAIKDQIDVARNTNVETVVGSYVLCIGSMGRMPSMNCDNCDRPFIEGDDAYQVERGRIKFSDFNGEFWFACGSNPCTTFITLCAGCYDDNWLIGEPLPKNQHLIND